MAVINKNGNQLLVGSGKSPKKEVRDDEILIVKEAKIMEELKREITFINQENPSSKLTLQEILSKGKPVKAKPEKEREQEQFLFKSRFEQPISMREMFMSSEDKNRRPNMY